MTTNDQARQVNKFINHRVQRRYERAASFVSISILCGQFESQFECAIVRVARLVELKLAKTTTTTMKNNVDNLRPARAAYLLLLLLFLFLQVGSNRMKKSYGSLYGLNLGLNQARN